PAGSGAPWRAGRGTGGSSAVHPPLRGNSRTTAARTGRNRGRIIGDLHGSWAASAPIMVRRGKDHNRAGRPADRRTVETTVHTVSSRRGRRRPLRANSGHGSKRGIFG